MLMTAIAYHVLCKSSDLLNEINVRAWENKKKNKLQNHHLIYLEQQLLVMFLIKYIQVKLKKEAYQMIEI